MKNWIFGLFLLKCWFFIVPRCNKMPQKNLADLLVNTCLFTKKDWEVLFNHFSHYEFSTLQKFQKNSRFHSFSVQRLIFLILNCLTLLYNATLPLPLCINTQKMEKKLDSYALGTQNGKKFTILIHFRSY